MSLPVRKSCGIVDCVSFLTLASICESLPTLLTSLSPGLSPPCRLDTDGIDLLMSFLKVSLTISARLERDVKSSVTHFAAMIGLYFWKEVHQGELTHSHAVTHC